MGSHLPLPIEPQCAETLQEGGSFPPAQPRVTSLQLQHPPLRDLHPPGAKSLPQGRDGFLSRVRILPPIRLLRSSSSCGSSNHGFFYSGNLPAQIHQTGGATACVSAEYMGGWRIWLEPKPRQTGPAHCGDPASGRGAVLAGSG